MADYGNNFTSSSGNYKQTTSGHYESASDWTIVTRPNDTKVVVSNTIDAGNNTTTYGLNEEMPSYIQTRYLQDTLGYYVVYFPFNENANTKGSISGNFSATIDSTQSTKIFQEPTSYDDTSNGYPTDITTTESLLRKGLVVKGTTDTRGYRKEQIQYTPYIEFNKDSNDDGTATSHATVDTLSRYDAFQTFYNYPDPWVLLSITNITNYDDNHSTSPVFCTVTNPYTTYKINHSYTYSPYINTATWDKDVLFKFTYNQLPTYPKQLVFTYSSNWNSVSYDGGTVTLDAKALLNGTYQGFTTSTATDTGFSTYKRYVDISYLGTVSNSSTTPTGIGNGTSSSYTMRIWQPASQLSISYKWTLPIPIATTTREVPYYLPNGKFDLLNSQYTEEGNSTTVIFNKQDHNMGSVGGTLDSYRTDNNTSYNVVQLSNRSYDYPYGSVLGQMHIKGVEWKAPTNVSPCTVTLRQNMQITNCIAQNITPKDSNGMPYKTITLTQQGMQWNNPAFNMNIKVEQVSKDTSTYNDNYDFGYPTLVIPDDNYVDGGSSYTCIYDGNEHTIYWPYNIDKKYYSAYLENKIPTPVVSSSANGNFNISPTSITVPSYLKFSADIEITPNLTFTSGYTSGVSGRTWKIKNTSNVNTEQEYGTVGTFNDITLKLDSIAPTNISYSTVKITGNGNKPQSSDGTPVYIISGSEAQILVSYSYTFTGSSSWNNTENVKQYQIEIPENYATIGTWSVNNISASPSIYSMNFSSTTKNASTRTASVKFSASTNKLGTIKCNDDTSTYVNITQPGTNISGTISYSFDVCDWNTCQFRGGSIEYPIDGTTKTVMGTFDTIKRGIKYVTGAGNVGTNITTSGPISASGATIYFKYTGTPNTESDSDKTITYVFNATSDIVSEYASGCDSEVVAQGSILPTGPNYKYQYSSNNSIWYDYPSSGTGSIYASSNYGSTTTTSATLTTNGATDIRDGLYDYTVGTWSRNTSSSRIYTIYTRVVDTNDTSIIYNGTSASITQSGTSASSGTTPGNFTITITAVSNCSVSKTSETVNYSSDKSNCGSFSATPSNTSYDYSGAYDKSDTRNYNYSNANNASATKVGVNKTFDYGTTTISETYGVTSVTDSALIVATGSRTWKVDYQYSVKASNETSAHYQTSTFNGSDSYSNYYVYAYISFNGGSYSRLTSSNSTKVATTTGTYSVSVKWATSATATAVNSTSFSFTYDTYGAKTEYRITTCSISVANKSYTAFDSPGSAWSVTATTSIVVQKRTSTDNGNTWTDWASTTDYSTSVSYTGYLTGTGTTASGSMSQGSNATDANSKSITFTLKVTCGDNSTTKTATATSTWAWYGKTYYNV